MDKIKTKITNHQLFALTACGMVGGSVIIISSTIARIAKQDAWITALITPAYGILVVWIICFLGSQYPEMKLIEIIERILGKWIGFIVAAEFVIFCITTTFRLPWYIGNFITTQAMSETPGYVVNLVFVITVVIAVLYGIETIARASELFSYFASILFFITIILVLPNAKIENLQPVFENGIVPIIKSSVNLSSFFTFPFIIILMIYPVNIDNTKQAKKSLIKGYLWAGFIIFITMIVSIMVLGSTVIAKSQYPTYLLAKEINVGMIFTRFEFVIAIIWIVTQFIITVLFFYAGVVGLAQLLRLKDYKKIVIPLGLIALVMSEVVFPNVAYQAKWSSLVQPSYFVIHGLILPVLLLLVFLLKKWIFKRT